MGIDAATRLETVEIYKHLIIPRLHIGIALRVRDGTGTTKSRDHICRK